MSGYSNETKYLCDSCRFNTVDEEYDLCADCMTTDDENGFFVHLCVDLRIHVPSKQEADRVAKLVIKHIKDSTNNKVKEQTDRDIETEIDEIEYTHAKEYGT